MKTRKQLIFPALQALITPYAIIKMNLPYEISKITALFVILRSVLILLALRLFWIFISSYIINISKLAIYFLKREKIISICLFPIYYFKGRLSVANFFWIYDDRTNFLMNDYLKNLESFENLRVFIKKRNELLLSIYCISSMGIIAFCLYNGLVITSWIFVVGAVEHVVYHSSYKTIEDSNGMAFAGIKSVDNRLLLRIIVNQCKVETLDISEEVGTILSEDRYDRDGGYLFNYLCLSNIFRKVNMEGEQDSRRKEGRLQENIDILEKYMNEKVDNILNNTEKILEIVNYTDASLIYKTIDKKVCIFYDNYREFLLYVLMYYRLTQDYIRYENLNCYIESMLRYIHNKYISDTELSEFVLSKKFYEFKELYDNVLNYNFSAEVSIFTGYDTLPLWKEQRENFIRQYNKMYVVE